MTKDLAEILKTIILNDNPVFIDRLESLVIAETQKTNDGAGKPVTQTYPVACISNPENCTEDNRRVTPDDKYRTVIYFEEGTPARVITLSGRGESIWEVTLRLIGWINMAKFKDTNCSISSPIIQHLISLMPGQPINVSPYLKIQVTDITSVRKSPAIFSAYSYNEPLTKFLTYPYDYFALDITLRFALHNSCKTLIELEDNECIS